MDGNVFAPDSLLLPILMCDVYFLLWAQGGSRRAKEGKNDKSRRERNRETRIERKKSWGEVT